MHPPWTLHEVCVPRLVQHRQPNMHLACWMRRSSSPHPSTLPCSSLNTSFEMKETRMLDMSPLSLGLHCQGRDWLGLRPSAGNGLVMWNSGPCCLCAGSPRSDIPWAALTRRFLCRVGQARGCTQALPSCTPANQKSWEQNPGQGVSTADKQLGSEATEEAEITFRIALALCRETQTQS